MYIHGYCLRSLSHPLYFSWVCLGHIDKHALWVVRDMEACMNHLNYYNHVDLIYLLNICLMGVFVKY